MKVNATARLLAADNSHEQSALDKKNAKDAILKLVATLKKEAKKEDPDFELEKNKRSAKQELFQFWVTFQSDEEAEAVYKEVIKTMPKLGGEKPYGDKDGYHKSTIVAFGSAFVKTTLVEGKEGPAVALAMRSLT